MVRTHAAVQVADEQIDIKEFEVPTKIGPREALVEVEACGMCGTDWEQYLGHLHETGRVEYPCIPGHEPVGRIAEIGDIAEETWKVSEGDRVAVEVFTPCGICQYCTQGKYTLCPSSGRYGFIPTDRGSGLWGGYAGYLHLRPNSIVHKISERIPPEIAVMYNPLGGGFEWVIEEAEVGPDDSVLILGPGQRGLASVIASNEVSADPIIVTGLEEDQRNLDLAEEYGATETINVEEEDVVERVLELTDGEGVDFVFDMTPLTTEIINEAIEVVALDGEIIIAGIKGENNLNNFDTDRVVHKSVTIRGVLSVRSRSYERAISLIESRKYNLSKLHTHTMSLSNVEEALRILGGKTNEKAIHIAIIPDSH